jgi:hypothetical protein
MIRGFVTAQARFKHQGLHRSTLSEEISCSCTEILHMAAQNLREPSSDVFAQTALSEAF